MIERMSVPLTERQMRLIEMLIERSENNSPMNDVEFSDARDIEAAIRMAQAQALGLVK